jgi:hypothetical protein
MSTVLDFDEKKFWIALFSIVARREAARESGIVGNLRARPPWLRVVRNNSSRLLPAKLADNTSPARAPDAETG